MQTFLLLLSQNLNKRNYWTRQNRKKKNIILRINIKLQGNRRYLQATTVMI